MPNAAPRSLFALSSAHQRGLTSDDYEVIVVDNGSPRPLSPDTLAALPANFRCVSLARPLPSPAAAANLGLELARGEVVGLLLDGARLATPGLLSLARRAAASHPRAVVTTYGWLLGHRAPDEVVACDDVAAAAQTQILLDAVDWPDDAYRLFEVARSDGSTGWFGLGFESSALFMPRALWRELGGLDERFDEPGGGFLGLDLYERALRRPGIEPMLLLGEGTVHQPHGGVSTDRTMADLEQRFLTWRDHYIALHGHDLRLSTPTLTYFGTLPEPWRVQFAAWILREVVKGIPELADVPARVDAAVAADPTPQGSVWAELHAYRDVVLDLRRAAASAAADAAAWRHAHDQITRSWSWRLTASLRWLGAWAHGRR